MTVNNNSIYLPFEERLILQDAYRIIDILTACNNKCKTCQFCEEDSYKCLLVTTHSTISKILKRSL